MNRRASRLIRQVVLFHLSIGSSALVACGGQTQTPETAGRDAASAGDAPAPAADAGACNDSVDAGPACTIISCVPTGVLNQGGCPTIAYAIYGTGAECGADDAGMVDVARCATLCPPLPADGGPSLPPNQTPTGCIITEGRNLQCSYAICGTGRRPRGLRRPREVPVSNPVGRFLARAAHLEAASVHAFERLADELEAHGAPRGLCKAARRAAADERRHAMAVGKLAKQAGAVISRVRVQRRARSLEAMAIENAVEGCVNETFGAAMALAQSIGAADPSVRAVMRGIAPDEMRHAELSRKVAKWISGRLDAPARARVSRARQRAALALVQSTAFEADPALLRDIGLPAPRTARAMARELMRVTSAGERSH